MATNTFSGIGLASDTTKWSLGRVPTIANADKAVIAAAAVCTLDGVYSWGDDTSSTTAASNSIVANGIVKASRTVNSSLTCRGTFAIAAGGGLDMGTTADPIPSSVSATLILNDSAAPAAGKHIFYANPGAGTCNISAVGKTRRRNTRLAADATSGSTSITVVDSFGWGIGDEICIASQTADPAQSVYTTITGGSSPTWSINTPLTSDRPAGTSVGNFSSNVVIRSSNPSFGSPVFIGATGAGGIVTDISNVRFQNCFNATGWVGAAQTNPQYQGIGITAATSEKCSILSSAIISTDSSAQTNGGVVVFNNQSLNYASIDDCALYINSSASFAYYFSASALAKVQNSVVYKSARGFSSATSAGGILCEINGGEIFSSDYIASINAGQITCNNAYHKCLGALIGSYVSGFVTYNSGSIYCGTRLLVHLANAQSGVTTYGTNMLGASLTGNNTTGAVPSQISRSRLNQINGDPANSQDINYHRVCTTDTSTTLVSTHSIRIQPRVIATPITYTFLIPGVAGVAQTLKPALRFDSAYGTATPPSISLSGQGVSQSWTCPAVADTWAETTLAFTPTTTGDITVTVTVQSTATTGYAWLDGIYTYPMTRIIRRWGYLYDQPQASLIADTRITLTQAAALALPVTVDHATSTVAISGGVTPSEALQAMLADLTLSANRGRAVHCTGSGATFATTYTVAFTGSGAVTGPYTDAGGLHVNISTTLADSFAWRLAYADGAHEQIATGTLTGATLSVPVVWTADRLVELRADHDAYRAVQITGVLTSSGMQLLPDLQADTVAVGSGLVPSELTEFTFDAPGVQVEITDPDNHTEWLRLYVAWQHYQTTAAGLASELFGRFTSADGRHYLLDQSGANRVTLLNMRPDPLRIGGGYCQTSDRLPPVDSSGGFIFPDFEFIYVAPGAQAITIPSGERVVTMGGGNYFARG